MCSPIWQEEFTADGVDRTHPSVVPDGIEGPVRGYLVIPLSYIEPKAKKGERFGVVLVG